MCIRDREVPVPEPYAKRTAQGLILGPDGEKMSKSKGNVIDPNDVVDEFGADVLRVYTLFMGDYEKSAPWSQTGIRGCKRFLDRVAALTDLIYTAEGDVTPSLERSSHKTIKKVSEDIDNMKFNTAIAALMTLLNDITACGKITAAELKCFITLLCPFAPHLTEEMWETLGGQGFLSLAPWPEYDHAKTLDESVEIAVQICGKLRGTIVVPANADQESVLAAVKEQEKFAALLSGKQILKEIFVKGKLVNIVAR